VASMKKDPKVGMVEGKQMPHEHPKEYDKKTLETSWCSGACVLIRRTALDQTGLFDDRFFMYCEDVDLSWRMWQMGWKCLHQPKATILHHTGKDAKQKQGSMVEFLFGIRNGHFMRIIYGTYRERLWYFLSVMWVIFLSKHHSKQQKKIALLAYLSAYKHIFYLQKRRKFRKRMPQNIHCRFFGWEYAQHRNTL